METSLESESGDPSAPSSHEWVQNDITFECEAGDEFHEQINWLLLWPQSFPFALQILRRVAIK
jgi:hypothetical protein